jgi:hypothetical protein
MKLPDGVNQYSCNKRNNNPNERNFTIGMHETNFLSEQDKKNRNNMKRKFV